VIAHSSDGNQPPLVLHARSRRLASGALPSRRFGAAKKRPPESGAMAEGRGWLPARRGLMTAGARTHRPPSLVLFRSRSSSSMAMANRRADGGPFFIPNHQAAGVLRSARHFPGRSAAVCRIVSFGAKACSGGVSHDHQIARAKELIAKREEIDTELAALFGCKPPARKSIRCTACGPTSCRGRRAPAG
jgi:hypothetical protein